MQINIDGVNVSYKDNGLLFEFEHPFYMLANRDGFDFAHVDNFDNHYANKENLKTVVVENDGISVVTSVEFFEKKYFTNISIFFDVCLDNITLLNIFRVVTESISTVAYQKSAFNEDELSNKLGNYYNMVYVACKDKSDTIVSFDISLYYEVKELVSKALDESFNALI